MDVTNTLTHVCRIGLESLPYPKQCIIVSTRLSSKEKPKKFSLRPDIVIRKNDTDIIVLDTKWKVLIDNENYGVSQADMYQMYAYAKKYGAEKVIVIYPMNPEMNKYQNTITFRSEDNVEVNLFLIDLINIESSVNSLLHELVIDK